MNLSELGIAVTASIALTQIAKKVGLKSRYAPLFSVVVGIGTTMLFLQSASLEAIGIGLVSGLTASGLYSGTKSSFK